MESLTSPYPTFFLDDPIVNNERDGARVLRLVESFISKRPESKLILSPSTIELMESKQFSELIERLAINPERVRDLTPRQFEELTAELFQRLGHEVELTRPYGGDGGFDMAVRVQNGLTRHLMLVECKRHVKPIGVGVVRGLHGTVDDNKASSGLVVASTRFTRDARAFEERHSFRIELADLERMQEWLRECSRKL